MCELTRFPAIVDRENCASWNREWATAKKSLACASWFGGEPCCQRVDMGHGLWVVWCRTKSQAFPPNPTRCPALAHSQKFEPSRNIEGDGALCADIKSRDIPLLTPMPPRTCPGACWSARRFESVFRVFGYCSAMERSRKHDLSFLDSGSSVLKSRPDMRVR